MEFDDLKNKNINLTALAEIMGYSRNHLHQVVLGYRPPTKRLLFMLSKISLDEFPIVYKKRRRKRKNFKNDN